MLLPVDTLNSVRAMQVYPNSEIHDDLFWGRASSGSFSLKSALEILEDERPATDNEKWKQVWKLEAPQKMKVFIWRVLHQAMLTNENRVRRGFASNPNCLNCLDSVEDINHILRSYIMASDVWHYSNQGGQGIHNPNLELEECIIRNINHTTYEPHWSTKFAAIIWWIWRWRNENCFGRASFILLDKIRYVFIEFEESIKALPMVERWHGKPNKVTRRLQWAENRLRMAGWH